jgi:FMN phosphatase YigB (HAD superfamily)
LKPIKNLVFDIGQVLVRLRPQPLLSLFAAHGYVPQDLPDVVTRVGLHEYEAGRFDGEELLSRLIALAPQPPPRAAVRAAWLDLFEPIEAMLEFARRARGPYRTFLLSNVGDLHWLELDRAYGLHTLTDASLPSYTTGFIKPQSEIYALAERHFALEPASTVFIDDRADNVAAAKARGWHALQHHDVETTFAALRALGIENL